LVDRKIDPEKIKIIYDWQDETDFIGIENRKPKDASFIFMYLGNIGPLAGIDFLINSFVQLKSTVSRLVIAGAGSMKKSLQGYVDKSTIANIEFWDVPENKVAEIQSFADVLLLPVKKGGAFNSIPSKLIAYMLSSKPILACVDEGSDTANTIKKANCGWILPPEDGNYLLKQMQDILAENRKNLELFGHNGYEFAIRNFSRTKNLNKLVTLIQNK
jgi:glycosyltransferase involved in cell wall biosynthesis